MLRPGGFAVALEKRPDAVAYPFGLFPGGLEGLAAAKAEFGPVLGSRRVAVANQRRFNFARPFPVDSLPGLLFPTGHAREKTNRHDWFEAARSGKEWTLGPPVANFEDGAAKVIFGYLKADPPEPEAEAEAGRPAKVKI